jgi:hypothetical protein
LTVITVSANPKLVTAVGSVLKVEMTTALRGYPETRLGKKVDLFDSERISQEQRSAQ